MQASAKAFYQYETSPRKLEPEYKTKKVKKNRPPKVDNTKVRKTRMQILKENEMKKKKLKAKFIIYTLIIFSAFFVMTYRNSLIDEKFMKVESLKSDLALLQKENEQLRVNIENSFNLATIEQQAKELLGMQKLDDNQKEYITLPKKEFIQPVTEKIIIENDTWYQRILNIIKNLW